MMLKEIMARPKRQFRVIIERDEDGFFVASVPALPGCYTQAKNLPELTKRIYEAISLCLEVAGTNREYRNSLRQFAYEPTFVGIETIEV